MAQDLHPLNMSRYQNQNNSCYFAGLWGLLHKYDNPLIKEIITNTKQSGTLDDQLQKFIIDYYNYIHTPTTNNTTRKFTDFLNNNRIKLLQKIDDAIKNE